MGGCGWPCSCPFLEIKLVPVLCLIPLLPGLLQGGCVEPRYCPSLETKFKRFPGRTHHVWLEPEGLETDVVYPNGLSNSMEPDDQLRLLRTVSGEAWGVGGRDDENSIRPLDRMGVFNNVHPRKLFFL